LPKAYVWGISVNDLTKRKGGKHGLAVIDF